MTAAKRALVTLPSGTWKVIEQLKGQIGDGDSEVIRNIVISYLTEKGYLLRPRNTSGVTSGIMTMAELVDRVIRNGSFLDNLIEMLIEEGLLTKRHSEELVDRVLLFQRQLREEKKQSMKK